LRNAQPSTLPRREGKSGDSMSVRCLFRRPKDEFSRTHSVCAICFWPENAGGPTCPLTLSESTGRSPKEGVRQRLAHRGGRTQDASENEDVLRCAGLKLGSRPAGLEGGIWAKRHTRVRLAPLLLRLDMAPSRQRGTRDERRAREGKSSADDWIARSETAQEPQYAGAAEPGRISWRSSS
jgi:hypothetical protein